MTKPHECPQAYDHQHHPNRLEIQRRKPPRCMYCGQHLRLRNLRWEAVANPQIRSVMRGMAG